MPTYFVYTHTITYIDVFIRSMFPVNGLKVVSCDKTNNYTQYIYIYIYLSIWVNYNDLTATSLESWLVRGIIPKWPYFRLVNYCNLPRYIASPKQSPEMGSNSFLFSLLGDPRFVAARVGTWSSDGTCQARPPVSQFQGFMGKIMDHIWIHMGNSPEKYGESSRNIWTTYGKLTWNYQNIWRQQDFTCFSWERGPPNNNITHWESTGLSNACNKLIPKTHPTHLGIDDE